MKIESDDDSGFMETKKYNWERIKELEKVLVA